MFTNVASVCLPAGFVCAGWKRGSYRDEQRKHATLASSPRGRTGQRPIPVLVVPVPTSEGSSVDWSEEPFGVPQQSKVLLRPKWETWNRKLARTPSRTRKFESVQMLILAEGVLSAPWVT